MNKEVLIKVFSNADVRNEIGLKCGVCLLFGFVSVSVPMVKIFSL